MLDAAGKARLEERYEAWSAQGIRVLAVASRPLESQPLYSKEVERDLTFTGFLTFFDRPKADVADAIRNLATLGVSIKVITGDCKPVTQHVAALVGLRADRVLTGTDLQRLSDEALWRVAESTDLFVEVDPNQKERIILAVKKMGHVVGFLGDGVNDAPAMHAADTSLSVQQAVDVARAAADFVLLERSLDVIRRGIEEGRKTFANTLKYVLTTMSANLGNMISMAAASLFLPFLPLLAGQILLNNLLSDVPAIGIADDAVDPELIARPQRWNMRFIGRFMLAVRGGELGLRFPDVRGAAAGVPRGTGPVQNGMVRRIIAHRARDCAGRSDAAPLLSQSARPGPALVDRGARRADRRHSLSAIHRGVRIRAVAGHAAHHRDGDYGAVCRRHRADQAAVLSWCALMRAARGEGLEQQRLEIVKFEGFVHHLVGAQVERAFRDLGCAMGRHQDHSAARRQAPDGRQQGQVVGIRKPVVEHHHVNRLGGIRQRSNRCGSVFRLNHGVPRVTEGLSNRPPNEQLILDHEHAQTRRNSCHMGKTTHTCSWYREETQLTSANATGRRPTTLTSSRTGPRPLARRQRHLHHDGQAFARQLNGHDRSTR